VKDHLLFLLFTKSAAPQKSAPGHCPPSWGPGSCTEATLFIVLALNFNLSKVFVNVKEKNNVVSARKKGTSETNQYRFRTMDLILFCCETGVSFPLSEAFSWVR